MTLRVQDLMSWHPPAVPATATVDEALAVLLRDEAPEIYVLNSAGHLVGLVPDFAFLKARIIRTPGNLPVSSLMTRSITCVGPNEAIQEVLPLFREGRCLRVAVEDRGRLVGTLSRGDILRTMVVAEQLGLDLGELGEPLDQTVPKATVPAPRFMQYRRTSVENLSAIPSS